jgi:NAD(P)-dependent dehydrogenase (short-subunit alcohol dehydrogenase family)
MADQNPTHAEPTPPFPKQEQEPPGYEDQMQPLADHGEETYVGHGRLKDKVALITGADSGIGRAVAIAFAREGADVLCSYLEEDEDAAETKRWVEKAGRRCITVAGDVGDRDHCFALVDKAVDELGRLDVLVNNAAYQMSYESFLDIPADEIDFVFRTNIISMFHLCQAAVPKMGEGSTIVNTTSIQAA